MRVRKHNNEYNGLNVTNSQANTFWELPQAVHYELTHHRMIAVECITTS